MLIFNSVGQPQHKHTRLIFFYRLDAQGIMFFNELLLIGGGSSLINISTHILTLSKLIKCPCIPKRCSSKERSLDVFCCPEGVSSGGLHRKTWCNIDHWFGLSSLIGSLRPPLGKQYRKLQCVFSQMKECWSPVSKAKINQENHQPFCALIKTSHQWKPMKFMCGARWRSVRTLQNVSPLQLC